MIGENGQLFGLSADTWLWLDQIGILFGNILILLSFLGAIVAFLRRDAIRRWLYAVRFRRVGEKLSDIHGRWQGIVFTISRENVPRWVIENTSPAVVALLASPQSLSVSQSLAEYAREKGTEVIGPLLLNEPDDLTETFEQAKIAIHKMRQLGIRDIATDITGGRTPMSIGAFLAAQELDVPAIYVATPYNNKLQRPELSQAVVRVVSGVEEK